MKTIDLECLGYKLRGDIYEGSDDGPLLLSLIGRTSNRKKRQYQELMPKLADELGFTSVVFDYSGHGDSPFNFEDIYPAQHFVEVITVFDWLTKKYPGRKVFVIGSSYGGYLSAQLAKYRQFDGLILRAPAIYKPSDFYTKPNDEDREATKRYRASKEKLASHPLLKRISKFAGDTLLIVHEHDEWIPQETTEAYKKAFNAEEHLVRGVTHSLDKASDEKIIEYNAIILNWLKEQM